MIFHGCMQYVYIHPMENFVQINLQLIGLANQFNYSLKTIPSFLNVLPNRISNTSTLSLKMIKKVYFLSFAINSLVVKIA